MKKSDEIKIDDKAIAKLTTEIKNLCDFLNIESNIINNDKDDIFDRYFSFHRLINLLCDIVESLRRFKRISSMGHATSHPFLQTASAIKNGWQQVQLENDEFFCTEKEKKLGPFVQLSDKELRERLKKIHEEIYKKGKDDEQN